MAAGSNATVSRSGNGISGYTLAFGIPRGNTGAKGDTGDRGPTGDKGDTGDPGHLELYEPTAESSSTDSRDVYNLHDAVSNVLSVTSKHYLTLNIPARTVGRCRVFVVAIDIGSSFSGSLTITWGKQDSNQVSLYQSGGQSLTSLAPTAGETVLFFFEEYADNRFMIKYEYVT